MKTLISLFAGAVTITEQGGNVFLNLNQSCGGGKVAGWLKLSGTIELGAMTAIEAGETVLATLLPASLAPLVLVIEGVVNTALTAME